MKIRKVREIEFDHRHVYGSDYNRLVKSHNELVDIMDRLLKRLDEQEQFETFVNDLASKQQYAPAEFEKVFQENIEDLLSD